MATLITLKSKRENDIAKEFFRTFVTCAEVSRLLYNLKSKTKIVGTVARCYNKWDDKDYLNPKRVQRGKGTITAYQLNLKPFFEYTEDRIKIIRKNERANFEDKLNEAKSKETKKVIRDLLNGLKEDGFNDTEKKFLNYIFDIPETREIVYKSDNFFEGILTFLEKIFFYNSLAEDPLVVEMAKAFFVEDKRYLKKYKNHREQYEEFMNVLVSFLDNITNKVKVLSHFNDEEYFYLKYKTKIDTYSNIPFAIPDYYSQKDQQNLLKRFEIVFYEKRKPTNEEMLKTRMTGNVD